MNTLYAQLKADGYTVSHVVDFTIYGEDWQNEKSILEQNGVKYVEISSEDECIPGDIYDFQNHVFVSKKDPKYDEVREAMKIVTNIDIRDNKYFLMVAYTNKGITFINGSDIVDVPARNLYAAVNCQLMPNGNFVVNEFTKTSDTPFFNNVYLLDKDRNILKHLEFDAGMEHECIVGSNSPRYYSPEFDYSTVNDNILLVNMYETTNSAVYSDTILDNAIYELDFDGNVLWQWKAVDHFDEFGFSDEEKAMIRRNPIYIELFGDDYDWIHINGVYTIGPNKWYEAGDERFHPDNLMCCSRNRSMIFIISKETGKVVWHLRGSDIDPVFEMPHYAHLIPKGLDGAGNLLFFDNGNLRNREYSRIVELNPITKEIVYNLDEGFVSGVMSCVQKLTDGNYLIGSSVEHKILVADKDKNIISESTIDGQFYRVNAYPADWFVPHTYTLEEMSTIYDLAAEENKHVSSRNVKLAETYINQYLQYQETLLSILELMD